MTGSVVYTRIPACDPELVAQAGTLAVADLHESMDPATGRAALFDRAVRPLNRGQHVAGQAVTCRLAPGDGLLGHRAVSLAGPGTVLVSSDGGVGASAMFAELISRAARRNGMVGAVLDGPIRDTDALTELAFPVWSAGVFCGHPAKRGPGAVNVPIVCGGVLVEPGDVIVADGDGVIAIPPAVLPGVLERARARAEREVGIRSRIDAGEPLFDILGLGPALDAAGVQEHDTTWKGV